MYEISKEAHKMLEPFGFEKIVLMKQCLNNYFTTGKSPHFDSQELRDLWFYLKVHELGEEVMKTGFDSYGTFAYIELRDALNKNSAKFQNSRFRVENVQ